VVQLGSQTVAAMSPANRQVVGRWLREARAQQATSLSPYLQEAIGFVDQGTPIIMALDLRDVLPPQRVQERLKASETMKNRTVDVDALTDLVCSIRGVTLGILIREPPYGSIKIDFDKDASMIADFAKPLLLEILSNQSAMIEDFEDWKPNVQGKRVTISGNLSPSGMRRIMSLMESPISFVHAARKGAAQEDPGEADKADVAQASKTYFDGIISLFEDLQGRKGTASHINQYGVWFDKYARKVDQLPMLNVDSELLDYGQYVATQLRNASGAIKGIGMRSRVRQVNAVANMEPPVQYAGGVYGGHRYGRYGWYGGYRQGYVGNPIQGSLRQEQSVRTQIRTQERVGGAANARAIMQDLKNTTTEVRRKMTEKYQIEF
jgi:hypothetical protein